MDIDEDIFGLGLGGEIRTSKTRRKESEREESWSYWCSLTERPKNERPDRKFLQAYRSTRDKGFSHDDIMEMINGASRLEPHARDRMDIRRAINAMTKAGTRTSALSLLDDDAPIIPWSETIKRDKAQFSLRDLERILGTEREDWGENDIELAGKIISQITVEDMKRAAKRVSSYTGYEYLFPSDIMRNSAIWRNNESQIKAAKSDKRDTYHAGESEDMQLAEIDLDVDLAASDLLLKGCPYERVRLFHNDAPSGFWEATSEEYTRRLEEDLDTPLSSVITLMAKRFDYNPDERRVPTW